MTADLHHLAAAYALDALDPIERRAFENHYESCEICSSEVQEFREVAGQLAASTASAAPAGLKSAVMAEVAQTRQLSPRVTSTSAKPGVVARFPTRMILAAAAALVLLAGVVVATFPDDDGRQTELVESADAIVTELEATSEGQAGTLSIIWSDERDQVAVIGTQLEDPGENMAYALWTVDGDGVSPAGLFVPEGGSVSELLDIDDAGVEGWGITIEPASGSSQPTTPIIFAANL